MNGSSRAVLVGGIAIIIIGAGILVLRQPARAPATDDAPSLGALPPATVAPADPTLLPPADVPPASATPAPNLLPPVELTPGISPATPSTPPPTQVDEAGAPASTMTMRITDAGFLPNVVTITTGTRVTFRNDSTGNVWPASALHPTHKLYPGSDITRCGGAAEGNIFDACGAVAPGESWSFTFTERGSWKYHDHLNPSRTGTIIVE